VVQNLARVAVANADVSVLEVALKHGSDCLTHIIRFVGEAVVLGSDDDRVVEVFHSYQFLSFDELIIAHFWRFVKRFFQLFFGGWAVVTPPTWGIPCFARCNPNNAHSLYSACGCGHTAQRLPFQSVRQPVRCVPRCTHHFR